MATLTSPYGKGTITVPDERVDRYLAAGWTADDPKPRARAKSRRVKAAESDDTSTDDE